MRGTGRQRPRQARLILHRLVAQGWALLKVWKRHRLPSSWVQVHLGRLLLDWLLPCQAGRNLIPVRERLLHWLVLLPGRTDQMALMPQTHRQV